jgi:quinol-cytochrome oxidoreductase complex cytochrome b subunit
MFYNPSAYLAFYVIMELNNEIYYGWWLRSFHANGASFFFLCVYIHMFRGIYYGSFVHPRQLLWVSGVILLVLMIITAFLGYILPWGQMSFWGAMVITSLLAAIPLVGADLIFLLWGGYSIYDATLHRFYSLHFTFPFIILILALVHIFFLHEFGSTNPTGLVSILDWVPFTPYYTLKDAFSIVFVSIVLFVIIFSMPDVLGHAVNYEKANFLITPSHIVPEWYLLFFYAILRSVTNKLLGFFFMICSLIALGLLAFLLKGVLIRSSAFKPWYASWFWILVVSCILLSWIGSLPVMDPYLGIGQKLSSLYFLIFLIFFPLNGPIERLVYDSYIFISIQNEKLSLFFNALGIRIKIQRRKNYFWNEFFEILCLDI